MANKGRKFPSSLNGGEGQDNADHRVGETVPQNPEIADVDPADHERDLEPREDEADRER
jgi:hypothetical protein